MNKAISKIIRIVKIGASLKEDLALQSRNTRGKKC